MARGVPLGRVGVAVAPREVVGMVEMVPPSPPPKTLSLANAEAVGRFGEAVPAAAAAPVDTVAAIRGEDVILAESVMAGLCVAAPGGALKVGPSAGEAVGLPVAPSGETVESRAGVAVWHREPSGDALREGRVGVGVGGNTV